MEAVPGHFCRLVGLCLACKLAPLFSCPLLLPPLWPVLAGFLVCLFWYQWDGVGMEGSKMGIVVWDAVGNSCGSESRLVVSRIKVPSRAASHTLPFSIFLSIQKQPEVIAPPFSEDEWAAGELLMAPFYLPTAELAWWEAAFWVHPTSLPTAALTAHFLYCFSVLNWVKTLS